MSLYGDLFKARITSSSFIESCNDIKYLSQISPTGVFKGSSGFKAGMC